MGETAEAAACDGTAADSDEEWLEEESLPS